MDCTWVFAVPFAFVPAKPPDMSLFSAHVLAVRAESHPAMSDNMLGSPLGASAVEGLSGAWRHRPHLQEAWLCQQPADPLPPEGEGLGGDPQEVPGLRTHPGSGETPRASRDLHRPRPPSDLDARGRPLGGSAEAPQPGYQPRYRRECVGELVQVDGSEHWVLTPAEREAQAEVAEPIALLVDWVPVSTREPDRNRGRFGLDRRQSHTLRGNSTATPAIGGRVTARAMFRSASRPTGSHRSWRFRDANIRLLRRGRSIDSADAGIKYSVLCYPETSPSHPHQSFAMSGSGRRDGAAANVDSLVEN